MKTTLLDRFMREVAPGRAVNRLRDKRRFDVMAGGYSAAEDTRLRTHQSFQRALNQDEDRLLGAYDREKVRLECWDLYRNNEITRGIVDRFADYAVWLGIWPQAQTEDSNWNKTVEAWWKEIYVPTCDYRQRRGVDFITFQHLTLKQRPLNGECGHVLLENGQLQAVEGDRIQTPSKLTSEPRIVEGIHTTRKGLVTDYYICGRDKYGAINTSNYDRVKRENFVHCANLFRFDQLHGVPDLAPAVNKLRDYDETDQYVIAKIKSDATNLYNRKTDYGDAANMQPRNAYTKSNSDSKDPQRVEKQEWGNVFSDGGIEAIDSKTPNQTYVPYLEHELRTIGACLGLPFEFVMLLFTQGSFSSQRAAMLHALHAFKQWHGWLIKAFCQPIWNWRIAKAIKEKDLPPAPARENANGLKVSQWWRVEWSVPYMDFLDPERQTRAEKEKFNAGMNSMKAIIRSQGRDRDDVFREKADDIKMAMQIAADINEQHPGSNVSWRDIIQTGTPGLVTADASGGSEGSE